jgi:L-2-amino-thiazoline-4-carboxylic acid hydrolase-like protein
MDENTTSDPTKLRKARQRVGDKVLGAEAHWLFGRVMPRQFLDGIGEYLHLVTPEREDELMATVRARAEELADADRDTVVDDPSKGALALCSVILAAFETLLPLFDGDERRTILYLQHVMGTVLKRPYEVMFSTLSQRDNGLDKIDALCRKEKPLYGSGWDMRFARPESGLFEIEVHRCFFRDYFARHDLTLATTVLCAWDANWMRAIDPSVSGLRAERTSLLSLGDDHCRFAVQETDDPLAGYSDTLNERFVHVRSAGAAEGPSDRADPRERSDRR